MESLQNVPPDLHATVAELLGSLIRRAATHGSERWGLTDFGNAVRLNVGWTEILTTSEHHLRLVVGSDAHALRLENLALIEGQDERGFYPSIPGSLLAELPYLPNEQFTDSIEKLRPALLGAVDLAARRRVGRGVRAGHSEGLLAELEDFLGEELPESGYDTDVDGEQGAGAAKMEGALVRVISSRYERNKDARFKCIEHYGAACVVCGFSFSNTYGDLGAGFIHVHHLVPLSEIGTEYEVDPIKDLRPVCPNCHAMLHREKETMSIEALRAQLIRRA
jgi:hypothetical protein